MEMGACVPATAIRPARSRSAAGDLVVRLGVPLLDEYLGFLAGRCRPNTVLAVAYGFLLARGDVAVNPVPRACRPGGSGSGRVTRRAFPWPAGRWASRRGEARAAG